MKSGSLKGQPRVFSLSPDKEAYSSPVRIPQKGLRTISNEKGFQSSKPSSPTKFDSLIDKPSDHHFFSNLFKVPSESFSSKTMSKDKKKPDTNSTNSLELYRNNLKLIDEISSLQQEIQILRNTVSDSQKKQDVSDQIIKDYERKCNDLRFYAEELNASNNKLLKELKQVILIEKKESEIVKEKDDRIIFDLQKKNKELESQNKFFVQENLANKQKLEKDNQNLRQSLLEKDNKIEILQREFSTIRTKLKKDEEDESKKLLFKKLQEIIEDKTASVYNLRQTNEQYSKIIEEKDSKIKLLQNDLKKEKENYKQLTEILLKSSQDRTQDFKDSKFLAFPDKNPKKDKFINLTPPRQEEDYSLFNLRAKLMSLESKINTLTNENIEYKRENEKIREKLRNTETELKEIEKYSIGLPKYTKTSNKNEFNEKKMLVGELANLNQILESYSNENIKLKASIKSMSENLYVEHSKNLKILEILKLYGDQIEHIKSLIKLGENREKEKSLNLSLKNRNLRVKSPENKPSFFNVKSDLNELFKHKIQGLDDVSNTETFEKDWENFSEIIEMIQKIVADNKEFKKLSKNSDNLVEEYNKLNIINKNLQENYEKLIQDQLSIENTKEKPKDKELQDKYRVLSIEHREMQDQFSNIVADFKTSYTELQEKLDNEIREKQILKEKFEEFQEKNSKIVQNFEISENFEKITEENLFLEEKIKKIEKSLIEKQNFYEENIKFIEEK